MSERELSDKVTALLISEHDFLVDEAEDTVKESVAYKPELWSENADPDELAKFLASDENDD